MVDSNDRTNETIWLEELVTVVERHYEATESPLLMSKFGQANRELREQLVLLFGNLGNAVRAVADRLEVVKHNGLVGQEAIAPVERVWKVTEELAKRSSYKHLAATSFSLLPRPIQIAFCVKSDRDETIAVGASPPFRYVKLGPGQAIPDGMLPLGDRYRHQGLRLEKASEAEMVDLWASYSLWSAEVNFTPEGHLATVDSTSNALTRLMNAQDPSLKSQIRIPLDVIEILLKHQ